MSTTGQSASSRPSTGALLEQAVLHAPDPLLLAEQGTVRFVSPSIAGCLGWSAADLTGRPLAELCHPDDRDELRQLISQQERRTQQGSDSQQGGVTRRIVRMQALDGSMPRVLVSVANGDGDGSRTVAATIREIDQRISREQSSEVLLHWHRELASEADEAFVQVDDRGQVAWASPAISSLLGWPPGELVGRGPGELAHPEDAECLRAAWAPVLARPQAVAARFRRADGTYAWLEVRGRDLPTMEGSPPLRMSRLRDMRELMAARSALAEAVAHHRAVIDAIIDPFVVLQAVRDETGTIVDFTFAEANQAAIAFNRTTPEQLIGSPLLGRHPAAGMTDLLAAYVAVVEEGTPFIRDAWSYPQDLLGGQVRKYDVRAVKFDDGLAQTWRDVTEHVDAGEALAKSEARLRAVVDAMVDPQLLSEPIRDADGRIIDFLIEDANLRACAHLGQSLAEIVGSTLGAALPELLAEGLLARYAEVAQTGEPAIVDDFPLQDPRHGDERIIDIRCTQMQGGQVNLTWRDVTERQRDRHRLAASEGQLRAIMDAAPVGMAKLSREGRFEQVNPALCRMLMHEQDWLRRHGIADILHPEDEDTHARMSASVAQGDEEASVWEERLVRSDGHTIWALHSLSAIRDGNGSVTSFVSQFEDVTESHLARERMSASERLYRLVAENATDVVAHLRNGSVAWVSPSVATVLGGTPADWLGRQLRDFIHPFDLRAYDEVLERASQGQALVRRARICTNDGTYHWVEAHVAPFRDESGRMDGVSASMRNVDVEVQALAELDRQTRIDTVTGLVTRREAMHRLEQAAGSDREPGGELGLLFCDIDHFKDINDLFGHAAGDAVLRTIAARISEAVRLDDVVARMGGDELLVLITGVHDLNEAIEVAEKVRKVAAAPIRIDGQDVQASLSIGVTIAQPGEPADELIARADAAMYQAKRSGRNRIAAIHAGQGSP